MPADRITIQDLRESLSSNNFSDEHLIKSVLRNRDLVNQSKFWDLPFTEQQWSLLFHRLNPYILLLAFFSKDANSKSGLMDLFYKLEPQIFQQVFSLHVHMRCKGFKTWLEFAECDASFKADMIRIWELQVQLRDLRSQLLRFLENYDSIQVLKSLSFFQYANQDSKKIWGNNRAIGHFFETWSSQIIYDYLNNLKKIDLDNFIKSKSDRPDSSLMYHGIYSMAYQARGTEHSKDEETAEKLRVHFHECFKKEAETTSLQVRRYYGLVEHDDNTREIFKQKLVLRTRIISYLTKAGISEIDDLSLALSAMRNGDHHSFIANHIRLESDGLPKFLEIEGKEIQLSVLASLLDAISCAGYTKASFSPFTNFDLAFVEFVRAVKDKLSLKGNNLICQIEVSALRQFLAVSEVEYPDGFSAFLDFISTDIPSNEKISKDFNGFIRVSAKTESLYMLPAITSKKNWTRQLLLTLSKNYPETIGRKLGAIREEYVAKLLEECGFEVFERIELKSQTGEFGEIDILAKHQNTWLIFEVKGFLIAGNVIDWTKKEMERIHAEASFQLKRVRSILQSDFHKIEFSSSSDTPFSMEKPDRIVSAIVTNFDVVDQKTSAENSFISLWLLQLLCSRSFQDSFLKSLLLEKDQTLLTEYERTIDNIRQDTGRVIDAMENLSFWEPLFKIGTGID
jgi:Holliday junction resolvase-like predicted endonuclease